MLNPTNVSSADRQALLSGDKRRAKQVILNSPGMAFAAPEMEAAAAPAQIGAAASKGIGAAEGAANTGAGAAQATANQGSNAARSASDSLSMSDKWRQSKRQASPGAAPATANGNTDTAQAPINQGGRTALGASNPQSMSDRWRQNQHAARVQADRNGLNGDASARSDFQPEVARTPGAPNVPLPQPNGKGASNKSKSLSQQYREARQQAKNLKAQEQSGQMGSELMKQATNQIQQQTSKLLQGAWENLIDSFGATLIWLNIHWFLSVVIGDRFFCKLGHEWIPSNESTEAGKLPGGSFLNLGYDGLGLLEKAAILILDAIVIILIIGDIVIYGVIAYMIFNPDEALWAVAGNLGDFFKIISAVFLSKP